MKPKSAALANDRMVEEVAQDFLLAGGSAVGAVLSGFFAAAGAYAGVLLGPVSLLVAGSGLGARAFDGRLRQPGVGTKRPRGFQAGEEIPDAARVAVPTSVAALLVAHAYDGSQKLASIMRPGITRAERSGAETRAALLRRIRAAGAGAMTEPGFVRPLLKVAGPSQGGLLTPADFGAVPDVDQPAVEAAGALLEPGWARDELDGTDLGIGGAVVAVDIRGMFAALSYRRTVNGFPLEDLELESPLVAVPVLRGVTRVAPGARLPVPAPIAIRHRGGVPVEVIASPSALLLNPESPSNALQIARNPSTSEVTTGRE
jgi:gamma-glutamyltranspeptidase/glutathione hydrolase